MRVGERSGDGGGDANGLVDRQLLLAVEPRAEALAFDIRHYIEEQRRSRGKTSGANLTAIEERQEIRMLEIRRDLDLGDEALGAEHGTELRVEDLERHLAIVLEIAGEVDGGHASGADLPGD